MNMKRTIIMTLLAALVSLAAVAGDEVIVSRQLTLAQRDKLPAKTVEVDVKRLEPAKHADINLVNALQALMDTIGERDDYNRTFVVMIQQQGDDGTLSIAIHSDDIVSKPEQRDMMWGDIQRGRCHYVLLEQGGNRPLLQQHFKQRGKLKFVQEFEFVNFPTPSYPTSVIANWSPATGLNIVTTLINKGLDEAHDVAP